MKTNGNANARLPNKDLAEAESDGSEDVEMPLFNFQRKKRVVTSEPVIVAANKMGNFQAVDTLGVDWEKAQESAVLQEVVKYLRFRRRLSKQQKDRADPELVQLLRHQRHLHVRQGHLVRTSLDPSTHQTITQVVVPRSQASILLKAYHEQSGHFGTQKTEAVFRR